MDRGVALIRGGSRGIGAAATAVVANIVAADGRAAAARADVAIEADVLAAFAAADAIGPLAALVSNAGIVGAKARVDELTVARVERMLAVNALGPIICRREAVRRMSTRYGGGGGSIVLVSSAARRIGSAGEYVEYVDYAASKGAVDTLGLGLAREVASEEIRVNVVRPGVVDTDLHAGGGHPDRVARMERVIPPGRTGRSDEIAAAVMWLLGAESSSRIGSTLDVAGGR